MVYNKLYIEIDENSNPVGHPIFESNLIYIHGSADNIPKNYVLFKKSNKPLLGIFDIDVETSYQMKDGIVTENHIIHKMNSEQIQEKINQIENDFHQLTGFYSWKFSIEKETILPPSPYPDDVNNPDPSYVYEWNEKNKSWDKIDRIKQ